MNSSVKIIAFTFCLWPPLLLAQSAQIVDSQPMAGPRYTTQPADAGQSASSNQMAELFYQVQLLQQEVQQLRGVLEEQAFEIKKLKQQRLDDYVDLDRRISALGQRGSASPTTGSSGASSSVTPSVGQPGTPALPMASSADELTVYRNAVDFLLTKKDFDAGAAALLDYLSAFPNGLYKANAQYWLGETYLAKNNLDKAKQWFETLLSESPDHSKAVDAKYKLGQVLHKQGDLGQAKSLLQEAAGTNTSTAKLAQGYLNRHF